jgi:tetratricopeptide (TPR) repeat protein
MPNIEPDAPTPRPLHLYKYLTAPRVDVLVNARIRFTQPSQLNDPFEHAAKLDGIVPAQGPSPTRPPDTLGGLVGQLFGHAMRFGVRAAEGAVRSGYGDSHGALSLTAHPDSLLMWAHYAAEHRGFVIEFDTAHPFFDRGSGSEKPEGLYPVRYTDQRPTLSLSEYYRAVLYKSPDWAYENEWRLLLPLSEAANSDFTDAQGQPVHLFDVPPESVSSVIVGCRAPESLADELADLLLSDPRYAHTRLLVADEEPDRYALRIGGQGRVHFLRALRLAKQEDEARMFRQLDLAVTAEPENAYYAYVRGLSRLAAKDTEGARSDLERSVEVNPLSANAWVALYTLARQENDPDGARTALGRAIEVDRDNPYHYQLRADLAFDSGDYAQAIRDATRVLELKPDDLAAVWCRASAYAKSGEWAAALVDTDRAIELDPDEPKFRQARAFIETRNSPTTPVTDSDTGTTGANEAKGSA